MTTPITTTFIARGKADKTTGEITEIKMIVDMEAKSDFKSITGDDINKIQNEGKSTTNNNIIFVTSKDAAEVGTLLDNENDLIAQDKALASKYNSSTYFTGGERRSRRSNHSKRAGRKQRNKSRRI
jgi:hypothetical protein